MAAVPAAAVAAGGTVTASMASLSTDKREDENRARRVMVVVGEQ